MIELSTLQLAGIIMIAVSSGILIGHYGRFPDSSREDKENQS